MLFSLIFVVYLSLFDFDNHRYTIMLKGMIEMICKTQKPQKIEFKRVASIWLQRNRIRWKASTYSKYYHIVYDVLSEIIGECDVSSINSMQVQLFANEMFENGFEVMTVKEYINVINCIIDFAHQEGYNASEKVRIVYPKRKNKEIQILSKKDQLKFVRYLSQDIDLPKLGILFALYTGIRCGELCALKWSDINLEDKTVTINKTIQRIQCRGDNEAAKTKVIIMPPKTDKSNRIIPIPDFLIEKLLLYACDQSSFFLTGSSEQYIEPRTMQNKFNKYISKSGITKIKFHALRHTFATRCIELGFDIKSLSEILGHANVGITMNLYVHSSFDLKIENMNKLNQIAV